MDIHLSQGKNCFFIYFHQEEKFYPKPIE